MTASIPAFAYSPCPGYRYIRRVALALALFALTIAAATPPRLQTTTSTRTTRGNDASPRHSAFRTRRTPVSRQAREPLRGPAGWQNTGCMARFVANKTEFADCENEVCFLFLQEAPYIVLDPVMKTVEEQILFDCASPPPAFGKLHGASFEIMARTPAKTAKCAWAGHYCSFNSLVDFVRYQHQHNRRYKFAITGLLLEFPKRLDEHIAPSISQINEKMVIIGKRGALREHMFPLHRLVRPFQDEAWGLFTALNIIFVTFAVAIAAVFGPWPVTVTGLMRFYVTDPEADVAAATDAPQSLDDLKPPTVSAVLSGALTRIASYVRPGLSQDPQQAQEPRISELSQEQADEAYVQRVVSRLTTYRVARRLVQVTFAANVMIFLIFYEIGVVNFLFTERTKPSVRRIDKLSRKELERYSVQKNAATESVFHGTVDPGHTRFPNESSFPWERCTTEFECFEWLLNDTHPAKLFVGFETIGTYELITRNACENLTIFNTDKRLYTFGAGWVFSRSVPEDYRRSIDVAILNMQISETLHQIVQDGVGQLDPRKCNPKIKDIGVGSIGVALFFFVAPFLVLCVLVIFWHCCCAGYAGRRRRPGGSRMSLVDIRAFCRRRRRRPYQDPVREGAGSGRKRRRIYQGP